MCVRIYDNKWTLTFFPPHQLRGMEMCEWVETRVTSLLHPTNAISCIALGIYLQVRRMMETFTPRLYPAPSCRASTSLQTGRRLKVERAMALHPSRPSCGASTTWGSRDIQMFRTASGHSMVMPTDGYIWCRMMPQFVTFCTNTWTRRCGGH